TDAWRPAPKTDAAATAASNARRDKTAARAPGRWRRRAGLATRLAGHAFALGSVAAGLVVYAALFVIAPDTPETRDLWSINRTPAIVVLDRHGEELAVRGARYGEAVGVGDLPPYLVEAFLATEDRRFYEHHGVDARGVARAALANLRSNGIAEGGSTITQQLAKNLFLSPEQSYIRKAREALLALWLEGRFDKDEILSVYLNRIYMGAGAFGVEGAARTYFNKSARDVTLAEAALLAGLPQAPSALAPTNNPDAARRRAGEVIDNLLETGAIDLEAAAAARDEDVTIADPDADAAFGYFFDYVAEQAQRLAGADAADLVVQTTLDPELQRAAAAAVANALDEKAGDLGARQGALIAFDNEDGALRAMVGGKSYLESQFNRATQARRQPGSAFKPVVFAAAFENDYEPTSRVVDQPLDIAGWRPRNYNNRFDGPVRLTEAMAQSINTVAVQISEDVGRDKVIEMARRLGLSSDIPQAEAGIALGAFDATLEDLTAAYLPFARGGRAARPYAIARIEDGLGGVVYERARASEENVVSSRVARQVTHSLYQVVISGTGRSARLGGRPAVGKTGTTNDWRDAWFIGYTNQLAAGVWVGDDAYKPMKEVTGGALPAEIWRAFMANAHEGVAVAALPGAYAAKRDADAVEVARFYADAARGFRDVRRDGRAKRHYRRAERGSFR
ncbi:MAG: transglycosylase domain-containing protein, partial [Parvularculaceae bacterium]